MGKQKIMSALDDVSRLIEEGQKFMVEGNIIEADADLCNARQVLEAIKALI